MSNRDISIVIGRAVELNRRNQLEAHIAGLSAVVEGWNEHLHTYSVIVPARLETPYLKLGQDMRALHDEYVRRGRPSLQDAVSALKRYLQQREALLRAMRSYASQSISNKWAATRAIADWVARSPDPGSARIHRMLREDETVTWRTAYRTRCLIKKCT